MLHLQLQSITLLENKDYVEDYFVYFGKTGTI